MNKRSIVFSPEVLKQREQHEKVLKVAEVVNGISRKFSSLLARNIADDASATAMLKQWSSKNSWHARADMPKHRGVEESLDVRGILTAQTSVEMLRRRNIGAMNIKGKKSNDAVGQDSMSISCLPDASAHMWELAVVADGHGPDAHFISDRLVQTLPFFLGAFECQHLLADGEVAVALYEIFKRAEQDLYSGPKQFYTDFAGATVTAVLRGRGDAVYVASVGDSRAIMFRKSGSLLFSTSDHKPDRPDERARIQEAGGVCVVKPPLLGMRIYDPESNLAYPGLNVSRSLGDGCAKGLGVIEQPEICKWEVGKYSDAYVLVASDGVWEFLNDSDVADFLGKQLRFGYSPSECVEHLIEKAKKLWIENENGYVDDITAVLISTKLPLESQNVGSRCVIGCIQQVMRAMCPRLSS